MQSHTDTRVQALSQAFALFNDTSRALADSYHELERRAADLSRQLAAAHSARLSELAAKARPFAEKDVAAVYAVVARAANIPVPPGKGGR